MYQEVICCSRSNSSLKETNQQPENQQQKCRYFIEMVVLDHRVHHYESAQIHYQVCIN